MSVCVCVYVALMIIVCLPAHRKNRGWRFHKELQLWFRPANANMEPFVKTEEFERSSYVFFYVNTWEEVRRDNFTLAYADIEETP